MGWKYGNLLAKEPSIATKYIVEAQTFLPIPSI